MPSNVPTQFAAARLAPRRTRVLHLLAAVLLAACGDPSGLEATDPTVETTLSVYALTGTHNGANTAISLPRNRAVRSDANLVFDVAFDIDAQGRALLYPMRLIVWNRLEVHQVGLLRASVPFDQLTRASQSGYTYDEVFTGNEGDVFVVQSFDPQGCSFPFPPSMFAKILIEDIDAVARVVKLRMTLNPNCGFRSFLEGIPRS